MNSLLQFYNSVNNRVKNRFDQLNIKLPTPFEYRCDISKDLNVNLWLKREDKIDEIGSGHKLRKLIYVMDDVLNKKASVIITGGSLPSSQCVAVSATANQFNIESHIVYSGDTQKQPRIASGNYLLTKLMASKVTWFECESWNLINTFINDIEKKERMKGKRTYTIYPGMATKEGFLGSLDLGLEVSSQIKKNIETKEHVHIVAAAGTGTTCSALNIAAQLTGINCSVHGICIGFGGDEYVKKSISQVYNQFEILMDPFSKNIGIHDYHLASAYDTPNQIELEALRYCLSKYRIIFDHNYMIKTYLGLKNLLKTGVIKQGSNVILIHSGGHLGLFGHNDPLNNWINGN
jgi:1-aminocyclopropane-1-carboxylate deaminase/D-cysteine desulfhydrase-like pyridoxal-dependent ACC family enzyme